MAAGKLDADRELSRLSWSQFRRWLQYMEVESVFPEERGNWQMATYMAMYANAHRDRSLKPTPFEPSDFMPSEHKPTTRLMTREEWLDWKDGWKAGGIPLDPKTGRKVVGKTTDKVK